MLFSNFENDVSLFEKKEDFKEYIYNKDIIDKYVEEKRKKGYILLAILYKEKIIGEIRFKKIDSDTYEIGIVLQNDRVKNRGIGSIAIEKAIEYAKNNLRVKIIVASILLNNSRSQHVFEKNGFVYKNDDEKFIYFYKKI